MTPPSCNHLTASLTEIISQKVLIFCWPISLWLFYVCSHILFLSAYSCWFFYFHTPVTFPHCRTSSLPTLLVCLEMFVLFLLKFVCEYSVVFLGFDSIFFLVLSHFLFYFLIVGPPPCQHPIFSVFLLYCFNHTPPCQHLAKLCFLRVFPPYFSSIQLACPSRQLS